RIMSRSALEPSPSVIRPATSMTLTSPTWRVLNLTLTSVNLLATLTSYSFPAEILDQRDFGAQRVEAPNLQLIHKRPDEKDTASGMPQQILVRERVRHRIQLEALSLIRNRHG